MPAGSHSHQPGGPAGREEAPEGQGQERAEGFAAGRTQGEEMPSVRRPGTPKGPTVVLQTGLRPQDHAFRGEEKGYRVSGVRPPLPGVCPIVYATQIQEIG